MNRVPMEGKVLNENYLAAEELRQDFTRHGVFAVNLISSPSVRARQRCWSAPWKHSAVRRRAWR